MKFYVVSILLFVSSFSACSDKLAEYSASGHTLVHGQVYLDRYQPDATVKVFSVAENSKKLRELAVARTNHQGEWDVDLGAYEGPLWITAEGSSIQGVLDAYEEDISVGIGLQNVSVTPVSHLAAAYARNIMTKRVIFAQATRIAIAHISDLLGGIHHQRVTPASWPATLDRSEAIALSDSVTSTLIFSALNDLARHYSLQNGVAPGTVITLETVLSALAQDIEADGIFDGKGFFGRPLKLRDTSLSSNTLRTDLALSMLRYINGNSHNTILGKKEIEPLAHSIATNDGPLFKERAQSFLSAGPIFFGLHSKCHRNLSRVSRSGEYIFWTPPSEAFSVSYVRNAVKNMKDCRSQTYIERDC